MQDISLDQFAVLLAVAAISTRNRCRLVYDYTHYTKLEKIKESACCDAEDLARLFDEDAAERAKLATKERRVETTA